MKKLNNKGFTLIELLAIIVILAIIMVVTIPTVLNSMNTARGNQLKNATDNAADWFTKQYELASIGDIGGGADTQFLRLGGDALKNSSYTGYNRTVDGTNIKNGDTPGSAIPLDANVLEAAGVANAADNIDLGKSFVYYNTGTNKFCVQLTAKDSGSFYINAANENYGNTAKSSGCKANDTNNKKVYIIDSTSKNYKEYGTE